MYNGGFLLNMRRISTIYMHSRSGINFNYSKLLFIEYLITFMNYNLQILLSSFEYANNENTRKSTRSRKYAKWKIHNRADLINSIRLNYKYAGVRQCKRRKPIKCAGN